MGGAANADANVLGNLVGALGAAVVELLSGTVLRFVCRNELEASAACFQGVGLKGAFDVGAGVVPNVSLLYQRPSAVRIGK